MIIDDLEVGMTDSPSSKFRQVNFSFFFVFFLFLKSFSWFSFPSRLPRSDDRKTYYGFFFLGSESNGFLSERRRVFLLEEPRRYICFRSQQMAGIQLVNNTKKNAAVESHWHFNRQKKRTSKERKRKRKFDVDGAQVEGTKKEQKKRKTGKTIDCH